MNMATKKKAPAKKVDQDRCDPDASPIQFRLTRALSTRSVEIAARRGLKENEQVRAVYEAWLARQP